MKSNQKGPASFQSDKASAFDNSQEWLVKAVAMKEPTFGSDDTMPELEKQTYNQIYELLHLRFFFLLYFL